MQQDRAIGLGFIVGVILSAMGTTDVVRELWISIVTPPGTRLPGPVSVFSAYLIQTAMLTWLTFRAYRFRHYGITSAAWVMATWEAIAMTTRTNLLSLKHAHPGLYGITAFIHVIGAASLFLAMGIRAHRHREQDERDARYAAQEYRRR